MKVLLLARRKTGQLLPLVVLERAQAVLEKLEAGRDVILEIEIGIVGGEEDGIDHSETPAEKLYTTPEDMVGDIEHLFDLSRRPGVCADGPRGPGGTIHEVVLRASSSTPWAEKKTGKQF